MNLDACAIKRVVGNLVRIDGPVLDPDGKYMHILEEDNDVL